MTGILKVQLFNLENSAQTLERIIFNDLTALESLPDRAAEKYEGKVLRKLHRLDEIQDEIDAVTAMLKEAGAWEPVRHGGNIYQYSPPKQEQPKPVKGQGVSHKAGTYWDKVSETMPEQGGTVTIQQVMEILSLSKTPCAKLVRHWVSSRKLALSSSVGSNIAYCRYQDKAMHQTTKVLAAIESGAVTVKAISFALGYTGHSSRMVLGILAELEEQGVIENATTGRHTRYRIITENRSQEAA